MERDRAGLAMRRRRAEYARRGVALVAVVVSLAPALLAQGKPLTGTGAQPLAFGPIFPGVVTTVPRTDAARAGRIDIRGTKNLQVQFDFALPAAMTGPAGQALPLAFDAASGGYATTATIGTATDFDPRVPLLARLSGTGRLYIWLGGTALPTANQANGAYSATITLTMAYTGL